MEGGKLKRKNVLEGKEDERGRVGKTEKDRTGRKGNGNDCGRKVNWFVREGRSEGMEGKRGGGKQRKEGD